MWMLGPLSIGAASSAAMMLWSPFYWGLYLSMSPVKAEAGRRVTVIEPGPAAQNAADDRDADDKLAGEKRRALRLAA